MLYCGAAGQGYGYAKRVSPQKKSQEVIMYCTVFSYQAVLAGIPGHLKQTSQY